MKSKKQSSLIGCLETFRKWNPCFHEQPFHSRFPGNVWSPGTPRKSRDQVPKRPCMHFQHRSLAVGPVSKATMLKTTPKNQDMMDMHMRSLSCFDPCFVSCGFIKIPSTGGFPRGRTRHINSSTHRRMVLTDGRIPRLTWDILKPKYKRYL